MRGLAEMELEEAPPAPAETLLVAHRNGSDGAFRELVERYRRPVYSYLVRTGVPESDRDDLFQDIFIKIHQRSASYDESRPLHPWLFTVVANTVRSYFGKQKVRRIFSRDAHAEEPVDVADDAPDGEALAIAQETGSFIERAVQALPPPQRDAFVLAAIEKIPLKDIASILDLPLGTVKTYVRRARLRLVESYERRTRVQS